MADAFEFQLNLTGTFASALRPANKGLDDFNKHADEAKDGAKALEIEFGKLGGRLGSLDLGKVFKGLGGGGFEGAFTLGIAEGVGLLKDGFEAAFEIAKKIGETVYDVGKEMITAASKAETMKVSFDVLLGSKEASKAFLDEMEGIAKFSPFNQEQLAGASRSMILAGFKPGEKLNQMIAAAIDTSVALGNGMEGVTTAFSLFQRVKDTGKVTPKSLMSVGIEAEKYFANLGELYHVSAKTAEKMAKHGQIANDSLTSVLVDEMAKKVGGASGMGAIAGAQTVETKLAKLKNLPEEYFRKISESKGYEGFRGFLDKLLEQLDPNGPQGQKIIASIERITDKILGAFGGLDISDTIDKLTDGVSGVANAFERAWPYIKTFAGMVELAAQAMGKLWDFSVKMGGIMGIKTTGDRVAGIVSDYTDFSRNGSAGLQGLYKHNALKDLGDLMSDASLEPSGRLAAAKAYQAIKGGGAAAAGTDDAASLMSIPAAAKGGIFNEPTLALIGESGPEAVVPLGRGMGASITFSPVINVYPQSTDAQGIASETARASRVDFLRMMDELGYGLGATG